MISEAAGNHYVQAAAAGVAAIGLIALTRGKAAEPVAEELASVTKRVSSTEFDPLASVTKGVSSTEFDPLGGKSHVPIKVIVGAAGDARLTFPKIEDLIGGKSLTASTEYPGFSANPRWSHIEGAARTRGVEIAERLTGEAGTATGAAEDQMRMGFMSLGGDLDTTEVAKYAHRIFEHNPNTPLFCDAFRFLTEERTAGTRSLSLQFPGTTQSDFLFSDLARRAVTRGIQVSGN